MANFQLKSKFKPAGGQPQAIDKLTKNLKDGAKSQTLLGVTGSGKTFTMANVIQNYQKPTLIISHNKTLAWQLYRELSELFPNNSVHYFVSYYDYYQPEAYMPQTDTYIEKDAKINEEIDRMRHAATQSLLTGQDTIIIASVSCIYNIGSSEEYKNLGLELEIGQKIKRQELLKYLTELQYERNDIAKMPGTFRVQGDIIKIFTPDGQTSITIELLNNKIENIIQNSTHKLTNLSTCKLKNCTIFPAKHFVAPKEKIKIAIKNIKKELAKQLKTLKKQNKLLEENRLKQRTNFDMEMLLETGYCAGIENYSRHLSFKKPGEPPYALLDYFDKNNFLTIIDESHMTISQIRAMHAGDKARKETLINFGFRLPSALDNRPLKFNEFEERTGKTVYLSATPGEYELQKSKNCVTEQLIRPTGLLDPTIEIHSTENQIPHLVNEIEKRIQKHERVLVTTVTKRLAETLTDFLKEHGLKANYIHSEIKTMERPQILHDLRSGRYDVIVGINLLREGLDLPEVSLVAILDADKEGFLRNTSTLIQTIGRASRHKNGHVIMYADSITKSMNKAMKETERRRKIQENYNKENNITPKSIKKPLEIMPPISKKSEFFTKLPEIKKMSELEILEFIEKLTKKMRSASKNLEFEKAAGIRDSINKIKKLLHK